MTGSEGIERLDDISSVLDSCLVDMTNEITGIQKEWKGLQSIGGQRDDHAAALLRRLDRHLADIKDNTCMLLQQLRSIVANPFGD